MGEKKSRITTQAQSTMLCSNQIMMSRCRGSQFVDQHEEFARKKLVSNRRPGCRLAPSTRATARRQQKGNISEKKSLKKNLPVRLATIIKYPAAITICFAGQ
jgi:hypothetical protein